MTGGCQGRRWRRRGRCVGCSCSRRRDRGGRCDSRGAQAADAVDRLPHGRQLQRGRGHRPGGVRAPPRGRRGRVAGAWLSTVGHAAGDRPPALGARAARAVHRHLAARAGARRPRARRRRPRRVAVDGRARAAREPDPGRARRVRAARGVRLRLRRDRRDRRQERGQLPPARQPRAPARRRAAAALRALARAARGAGAALREGAQRGRDGAARRAAGGRRRVLRRRRRQGARGRAYR